MRCLMYLPKYLSARRSAFGVSTVSCCKRAKGVVSEARIGGAVGDALSPPRSGNSLSVRVLPGPLVGMLTVLPAPS